MNENSMDKKIFLEDILKKFNVCQKTIYNWIKKYDFPTQYKQLGKKEGYWSLKEVESWEAEMGIKLLTKTKK